MEDKKVDVENNQVGVNTSKSSPTISELQSQIDMLRVSNAKNTMKVERDKFIQNLSKQEQVIVGDIEDISTINKVLTNYRALDSNSTTPVDNVEAKPEVVQKPEVAQKPEVVTKKVDDAPVVNQTNTNYQNFGSVQKKDNVVNGSWEDAIYQAALVVSKATQGDPEAGMDTAPREYANLLRVIEANEAIYNMEKGK